MARFRDVIEVAREAAPCIVFMDALDRSRGAMPGFGGSEEGEQTPGRLLSDLDGLV